MWSPSLNPPFSGSLSDICATAASSAPELFFATFGISLQGLCRFAYHYSSGSPVPLQSPGQGSCHLYAVRCVPVVRFPAHSSLKVAALSIYRSKSYFRHLQWRFTCVQLPCPYHTQPCLQLTGYALTLSLNTIAWTTAPQGGLVNTPEHLYR